MRLPIVFPVDREFARLAVCPTNVGETQKAEGLRVPYSTPLPVLSGKAPEFNQARFLRMQLQPEFRQPFPQLLQELLRVLLVLKPQHGVARPRGSHPEPLSEPYVNLAAHTAPTMEPRRTKIFRFNGKILTMATPICQCAHSFGSRLEILATQCVAL